MCLFLDKSASVSPWFNDAILARKVPSVSYDTCSSRKKNVNNIPICFVPSVARCLLKQIRTHSDADCTCILTGYSPSFFFDDVMHGAGSCYTVSNVIILMAANGVKYTRVGALGSTRPSYVCMGWTINLTVFCRVRGVYYRTPSI